MENAIEFMRELSIIAILSLAIAWVLATLYSRKQIQRARQRGLWPHLGHIPTDEDIKRLAKAGEKMLAIKMCRQVHNMSLTEAKAVVEKMAEHAHVGNGK